MEVGKYYKRKWHFSDPFHDFLPKCLPSLFILCKTQSSLEKKKDLKTLHCSSTQEAYILIKEQNTTLEAAELLWSFQGCNHCLGLQLNKRENKQWTTEKLCRSSTTREFATTKGRIKLSVSRVKANWKRFNSTKRTWKYTGLFKAW